jgi:hypothetical protein
MTTDAEPYGSLRHPAARRLTASRERAAVLHYDHHFEPLCDALGVESIWLAESGSLD